jgi:prepilin-type N-terminal cleavage/methylation domain-containing protein
MRSTRKTGPASGFTLVELLVVLALLMVLIMISGPPLMKYIARNKIMSAAQQTQALMRLARIQAIKLGTPTVVQIQPTAKPLTVTAYVDTDRDLVMDSGEQVIGKVQLEKNVSFLGWYGLTPMSPSTLPPAAVFLETGWMDTAGVYPGGYQFTDIKGNELEVHIERASASRIEVRKHQGTAWVTSGEGGSQWTWK